MVRLDSLFAPSDLEAALTERLVVRRDHPTLPLHILNYTERCQYEPGLWSPLTRQCRGLIYHRDTGEVVARPFPKFFNHGQAEAPTLDLSAPVIVTDKLDGSLGILYPAEGGWAIATRGSFTSEQAQFATDLWRERYADVVVASDLTLLFEIVYPANRIVLDYAGLTDLILLGAVWNESGRSLSPHDPPLANWTGPRAALMPYPTLGAALTAPPRPNAEGVVIHVPATDERVKVKQEDYIRLHRIVTGLNERVVWEHLAAGQPIGDLLAPLPDEFHEWTLAVADRLERQHAAVCAEVADAFDFLHESLPEGWTRKEFALRAIAYPFKSHLFAMLDGRDIGPGVWKELRPEAGTGPSGRTFTEDNA